MKRRLKILIPLLAVIAFPLAETRGAPSLTFGVARYRSSSTVEATVGRTTGTYPLEQTEYEYDGNSGIEHSHWLRHLHEQAISSAGADTQEMDAYWATTNSQFVCQAYYARDYWRNGGGTNTWEDTNPANCALDPTSLPPVWEYCDFKLRLNAHEAGEVDNNLLMNSELYDGDTNAFPWVYHTRVAKTTPYALLSGATDGKVYFVRLIVSTSKFNRSPNDDAFESSSGSIPLVCTNASLADQNPLLKPRTGSLYELLSFDQFVWHCKNIWTGFWGGIDQAHERIFGDNLFAASPWYWLDDTESTLKVNGWPVYDNGDGTGTVIVPIVAGQKTPLELEVRVAKAGTPINFHFSFEPVYDQGDIMLEGLDVKYAGGTLVPDSITTPTVPGDLDVAGTITTSSKLILAEMGQSEIYQYEAGGLAFAVGVGTPTPKYWAFSTNGNTSFPGQIYGTHVTVSGSLNSASANISGAASVGSASVTGTVTAGAVTADSLTGTTVGGTYSDFAVLGTDTYSGGSTTLASYSASTYFANSTGGTGVITLPYANACSGQIRTIKVISPAPSGSVATQGTDKIDGASSYSLTSSNKFVTVQSDGSNWWIIGQN
ncbi:MAG: hypothetical protein AB9869_01300 [Verrucomicrobiia bacterium]